MESGKKLVPLIIGTYGLSLSSYLLYKNREKNNWGKTNGHIDNVTLKYSNIFLQGAFYINIKYNFLINNEKIESNKEYKIYVNLLKNKSNKNVKTNEYVQNIFDQVSKEKNINVSYNLSNFSESEPLVYIYDNDIISKHKLFYKIKSKLLNIKAYLSKKLDVVRNSLSQKGYIKAGGENSEIDNLNGDSGSSNSHLDDINVNYKILENKKKLVNSYDVNNSFPTYMFFCSLFLIMSFFLKKRILYIRKELSQKKINKI